MRSAELHSRLPVATMAVRGHGTILAAVVALLGARSMAVAGTLIAIGVILDIVRSQASPDVKMGTAALRDEIQACISNPTLSRPYQDRLRRLTMPLLTVWWGYSILILMADWLFGSAIQNYLHILDPIGGVLAAFVPAIRNHPAELLAHGYPARATLTMHFYTFNYVMFFLYLIVEVSVLAYLRAHPTKVPKLVGTGLVRQRARSLRHAYLGIFAFAFAMYFTINDFESIDWSHTRYAGWIIQASNWPFPMVTGALWVSSTFFGFSQVILNHYRALPAPASTSIKAEEGVFND